jgi:hypothetical protein
MDVEIGEMESVIHVTDNQALLDPKILERIVLEVMSRMKESQAQDKKADMDRNYTKSVTGRR